jgi:hypothetical protein
MKPYYSLLQTFDKANIFKIMIFVFLFALIILLGARYLPIGIDWETVFRPACLTLLNGQSPYEADPYFGIAPWALLPLLPLSILPVDISRALLLVFSMIAFAYSIHTLSQDKLTTITFLLSPIIMHSLLNANIDWMPLLGFVLPPQIGLFFVTAKPQMASVVIIFWFVEAWRMGGIRQIVVTFSPIIMVGLLSMLIFGLWPQNYFNIYNISMTWNASLFPASIPIGFGLLIAALRTRKINFAMAASPCLSPYVLFHAWSGALASIAPLRYEMIAVVIGLWILMILRFLNFGI